MDGLAKVAWTKNKIREVSKRGYKIFDEQREQNRMSPEEIEEAFKYVKDKYGLEGVEYLPRETMKGSQYRGLYKDDEPTRRIVTSPDDQFIFLHELGHAVDDFTNNERLNKDSFLKEKIKQAPKYTFQDALAFSTLLTPVASYGEEDNELRNGALIGLGFTGLGAGKGYLRGKKAYQSEDRANQFVEEYLSRKYQNPDLAKKLIQESPLPDARKTYDNNNKRILKDSLLFGLGGTAIGTGVGAGISQGAKWLDDKLINNGEEETE